MGMNNPRPPIYAWSVALTGMLVGFFQGSVELGVWQSFLFSTAIWGALTIFPTYFLGRDIFGHRAGLVAAFFLAILPAHIQRTPFSNGDHDALVLFFVVTSFYFLLRALAELRERTWVERWTSPRVIYRGLRDLVLEGRRAILYSIMSGTAVATVALTWQGWAYVPIVIIAYFIVQLLVHKLRNQDPLGVLLVFTVTLGTAHLLAAPYYMATGFVRTWFDVPLILFAASVGLGVLFTVFHRLPWLLVIPPILLGFGAGLVIASTISPVVAGALSSGFGYFAPDKVYETIAEAQPPNLSEAILSFGAVTYYLSMFGIGWMAIEFVRRPRSEYLFALAWSAAAIFMGMLAVRFIFNASPAFALTSAWITVLLVERLGLEKVRKAVATTGASKLSALRKGIKARHVAGALFVAILLVLPNTWLAVDAAIPFEKKRELDLEVYNSLPAPLRPAGYEEGSLFYFGAFGYSLPPKNNYFPRAWEWLSEQDSDIIPIADRPAFLSWWDYGFEAIAAGKHPTVADNFQNGYEFAGHFLLAQTENDAIAVLNLRLLEGDLHEGGGTFSPAVVSALEEHGLDPEQILDVFRFPGTYIPLIRADPERFGRWDERLSPRNARLIFLKRVLAENLNVDGQADLYRSLRMATGSSIGYFAVDSRLIPFSGTNTGIFYAPAKLTDHRVSELPDLRSIPIDFYRLIATTDRGEFDLDEVPPTATIQGVRIEYEEMFNNSFLYRIFFGLEASDLGIEGGGLPGISGEMAGEEPRHGWMLEHFRVVYRTAYYNPYPPEDVANHSEAWTAINFPDALALDERIRAGEAEGVVDLTPGAGLRAGIVILEYYDGAQISGKVTGADGRPLSDVRVTVLDEFDVPHDVTFTDSQGLYELTSPFGEVRVVASSGVLDARTQTGQSVLGEQSLTVRRDQAAREPLDLNFDGRPDYLLRVDFRVADSEVAGRVFLDLDRDGSFSPGEEAPEGLRVEVQSSLGDIVYGSTTTGPEGAYHIENLLPRNYRIVAFRGETELAARDFNLAVGESASLDVGVEVAGLNGRVTDEFGEPVSGITVELREGTTGIQTQSVTDAEGNYTFQALFDGRYTLTATPTDLGILPQELRLFAGVTSTMDLTARAAGILEGRVTLSGRPTSFVTVDLYSPREGAFVTLLTDETGRITTALPAGVYEAYAVHYDRGIPYSLLQELEVLPGSATVWNADLRPAIQVQGRVMQAGANVSGALVALEKDGARRVLTTSGDGSFFSFVPPGFYRVWSTNGSALYTKVLELQSGATLSISLSEGVLVEGRVFHDLDGDKEWSMGEGLSGARVQVGDGFDSTFWVPTEEEGRFAIPLLANTPYTVGVKAQGFEPFFLGPLTASELSTQPDVLLEAIPTQVEGRLLSPESLELAGVSVKFDSSGLEEAVEASAGADGSFSLTLPPGIYQVSVDAPAGGEDTRIQGLKEQTLRIPVGMGQVSLEVEVVKRLRVRGEVTVLGDPFGGDLHFNGTEIGSVVVDGNFTAFLRPGLYTFLATTTAGGQGYILLESVNLTAPMEDTYDLVETSILTGTLRVDGEVIGTSVTLDFLREDGARVQVSSGSGGSYLAGLGNGTYQVKLDWRGLDSVSGQPRYVHYSLEQDVTLEEGGVLELDLPVSRSLDNITLTGEVTLAGQKVGARLYFQARSSTAINATFDTTGPFTAELAPGEYALYAYREVGRTANLTLLELLPGVANQISIPLEAAERLQGVATLEGGVRAEVALEFRSTSGSLQWMTDSTGAYEVFLPSGGYAVTGGVSRMERGIPVEYVYEDSLALTTRTVVNPVLNRVDRRGVEILWDSGQLASAAGGEVLTYSLTVRNTGNLDDTYRVEASVPGWTFGFSPKRLTLPFGTSNEGTVTVTIVVPANAKVDHEPLNLEVVSTTDASVGDIVEVDVDVLQLRGIALRLSDLPPAFSPEALEYVVQVVNEGNGEDTYTLILLNPSILRSQGWEPSLIHTTEEGDRIENVAVGAGTAGNVTLRLEQVGRVSTTTAVLLAYSNEERQIQAQLEVHISFPSLTIPEEGVDVFGRNVRVGPPEFPVYLYGLLVVGGLAVAFLLFRRGGRRRRR